MASAGRQVVDAGFGQVALHSAIHNRFARMWHSAPSPESPSAHLASRSLPSEGLCFAFAM